MNLISGLNPNGIPQTVRVDGSGALLVAGGGGGSSGGSSDTTEATQLAVKSAVESVNSKTPALEAGRVPVAVPAGLATEATAAATLAALPSAPIEASTLPALASPSTAAEWLPRIAASTLRAGSFLTFLDAANGTAALEVSHSPITTGTDTVDLGYTLDGDIRAAVLDYAIAGRSRHSLPSVELSGGAADADIAPIAITLAYHCSASEGAAYNATAGVYLTATLSAPLPDDVRAGDLVSFANLPDSRLNYPNCPLRYISLNRLTVCVSTSDASALASLAVTLTPPAGTAHMHVYRTTSRRNAVGLRFDTTTTTAAVGYVRAGADTRVTGSVTADQRVTTSSTAPVYALAGLPGQMDLRASSRFSISADPDSARVGGIAADSVNAAGVQALFSTQSVPGALSPRLRQHLAAGASRAVAKIVSAVHATAATATVVTLDITPTAAGLGVGRYVSLRGIANQTTFANATGGVAITAIDDAAKTITVAWGAATAATSYGGTVVLQSGSTDLPGVMTGAVQTAAYDATTGIVTLVANTNWGWQVAGGVGDHVELHGVRDAAGADLGLDGCWRVHHLTGASLLLRAVNDINGTRISPQRATLSTTPAGGTAIQRTVQRLHRIALESRPRQVVSIDGAGTADGSKAVPVWAVNAITQGAAATATGGAPGWSVSQGLQQLADLASGAITTTTTSGPFTLSGTAGGVGAFQFVLNVSAVSGTAPTMDVSVEVQDDSARWYKLYDLPRITSAGQYSTPELRTDGRSYRLVQTLGGTSPSFTRSVTRNNLPFVNARHLAQMIDRTIVLTTLGSTTPALYCDGPADLHLVVNIGAATTPPDLQVQVSEDNGASWVGVGSAVTAVASGTVKLKVPGEYPRHARAVVTAAGAGVTMGYVLVKAVG